MLWSDSPNTAPYLLTKTFIAIGLLDSANSLEFNSLLRHLHLFKMPHCSSCPSFLIRQLLGDNYIVCFNLVLSPGYSLPFAQNQLSIYFLQSRLSHMPVTQAHFQCELAVLLITHQLLHTPPAHSWYNTYGNPSLTSVYTWVIHTQWVLVSSQNEVNLSGHLSSREQQIKLTFHSYTKYWFISNQCLWSWGGNVLILTFISSFYVVREREAEKVSSTW